MKGVYRYWRDGVLQDVVEPWELTRKHADWLLSGRRLVNGAAALEVEARYAGSRCTAMRLNWLASAPPRTTELAAAEDSLLFPLLRAGAGPLLTRLAEGPRTVLVPNIRDAHGADFLTPLLSRRHAALLDADRRHYRYYGGEYGEAGADYWLDARGLLLRYRWASPQGEWTAVLEDLSGAEDIKWA